MRGLVVGTLLIAASGFVSEGATAKCAYMSTNERFSEAVVHGWTPGPRIEDAYPRTDVGTQIILFSRERSPYEIMSCNAADPHHQNEVSDELDAITRKKGAAARRDGATRGWWSLAAANFGSP